MGGYHMRVDTLPSRVARAQLAATAANLADEGRGGRVSGSAAGRADPAPPASAADPGPPKRPAAENPSAIPPNLQKKFQKKNIPGVHRSCTNCYFGMPIAISWTCHANAPRPTSTTDRVLWPLVKADDWCGEWQDRVEAMAPQDWDGAV